MSKPVVVQLGTDEELFCLLPNSQTPKLEVDRNGGVPDDEPSSSRIDMELTSEEDDSDSYSSAVTAIQPKKEVGLIPVITRSVTRRTLAEISTARWVSESALPPAPRSINVSIKSKLPELLGLDIIQQSVDVAVTWADFFDVYKYPFDKRQHVLQTSRNEPIVEDAIQETANWFQIKAIIVKVIRITPPSRGRGKPKGALNNTTSHFAPQSSAQSHIAGLSPITGSVKRRGRPPKYANAKVSRLNTITGQSAGPTLYRNMAAGPSTSNLPRNVAAGLSSHNSPNTSAQPDMRFNGQRKAVNGTRTMHINIEEGRENEDRFNLQQMFGSAADNRGYAESVCSQESQVEDDEFSARKWSFLRAAYYMRNSHFDQFYAEVQKVKNFDFDRRFRWSSKTPLMAGFIFGWVESNPSD